jgi:formylglycine-generating enzyme required for sulfatase activity
VPGKRVDGQVEAREPDLAIGAHIGRYVILERVGNGAMGVVYGAYDPELDRKIALKLLRGIGAGAAPLARARMMREAKAMARLSHPNVAAVHDVGVSQDDRVFLATEFLSGGTVRAWLEAAQRPWREIVAVFVAAGRGLAAAHAEGLVHRDFKPDNVLLDKDGRARVVDFGLARNIEAAEVESKNGGGGTVDLGRAVSDVVASPTPSSAPPRYDPNLTTGIDMSPSDKLDKLTRTGALMGTPAYMAPEQFLGEPTDERTDQFSFCVALYEALFGQRPFEGDSLLALSASVTTGIFRPLPKDREVPAWIRRAVLRGLRIQREERYPSMGALLTALEADPAAKRRRHLVVAGVVGAALASAVVARQVIARRHAEVEARIAGALEEAASRLRSARAEVAKVRELRGWAFEAFDGQDPDRGESLWRQAQSQAPGAEADYGRAEAAFETAFVLDGARVSARDERADVLAEHIGFARDLGMADRAEALRAALAGVDATGARRAALDAPGTLALAVRPPTVALTLERYESDPATDLRMAHPVAPPVLGAMSLPPGSYRLTLRGAGLADVLLPFEIEAGGRTTLDVTMPSVTEVPPDFAYVPAGRFWFGDGDERLRTGFLDTVPIHRRTTGAYLIARHETTYAEWISFLEALPAAERASHVPDLSTTLRGSVRLKELGNRQWQLAFQQASTRYTARSGEPFVYEGRTTRSRQDWSQFPVVGVALTDIEPYLAWLRTTGRVPGARVCNELEWERAARGADDRVYPHGDGLQPQDANFDTTYGRVDSAYGPDAVGSHPPTRSPFGIDDMTGNVFEFTASALRQAETVIRGGAYFFNSVTCRLTNRNTVPAGFRDITTGIRVCASIGGSPHVQIQN